MSSSFVIYGAGGYGKRGLRIDSMSFSSLERSGGNFQRRDIFLLFSLFFLPDNEN